MLPLVGGKRESVIGFTTYFTWKRISLRMQRRQRSISINESDDGIFGRCVILPRKATDFEFYERSFQDAIRYYKFR